MARNSTTSSRNPPHRPSTQIPRPRCRHTAPPYRLPATRLPSSHRLREWGSVGATTFPSRQRASGPFGSQGLQHRSRVRPLASKSFSAPPQHPPFVLLVGRDPLRQHRYQTPPTRIIGRLPDRSQPRQTARLIAHRTTRHHHRPDITASHLKPNRRLAVIAQQLHGLVDELSFVLRAGVCNADAAFPKPDSVSFDSCFCPFRPRNRLFGSTYPLSNLSTSPGNNTFGAIRRLAGSDIARKQDLRSTPARLSSTLPSQAGSKDTHSRLIWQ